MDHQAFAQLLGNYGEFFGSVAILGTLVYLSIQIRQAGRSTTLAAVQANRAERLAWFQANRDSAYLPAILRKFNDGEPLDEEESYRLRSHASALWGFIYSQWIQQELGFAGRFATKDTGMLGLAVTTPGGKEWWESNARLIYPNEFCRYVDGALAALDRSQVAGLQWGVTGPTD